jgi:type II secretion system protein I
MISLDHIFSKVARRILTAGRTRCGTRRATITSPFEGGLRGMLKKSFRNESGMTLLEIILATVIFATALTALAMALGQGVRAFTASNNMQAALIVAQQRMVEWKLTTTGETGPLLGSQQGERMVFNRKFLWQHDIEVTDDPDVLKSTVTVQWGTGPQAQERKFVTLISAKAPKADTATTGNESQPPN